MDNALRSGLREMRQRLGLQQQDLANRIGVSRQTLSAIEAGGTVPSTLIALSLARVLQCRVEDLFGLADDAKNLDTHFIDDPSTAATDAGVSNKVRVAIAQVGRQWIARPLDGDPALALGTPADGIAQIGKRRSGPATVRVRPLRDLEALRRNMLVAGCDPALGLLGRHLEERLHGPRLHWVDLSSQAAIEELAAERVHVAGLHLDDVSEGNMNAATVHERFGDKPMMLVTLSTWEMGLVTRPRDGKAPHAIADLTRKGLRIVAREPGSGAQRLFESALAKARVRAADLHVTAVARGHRGVAHLVATSVGDVGMATRFAALPMGLDFTPIAEARFDLAFSVESTSDVRMRSLLDCLSSARFRKDLGAMIGYQTSKTGNTVRGAAA
jgi:molybdate-binding protein/DNA-binding XRE family transcriptional regulator